MKQELVHDSLLQSSNYPKAVELATILLSFHTKETQQRYDHSMRYARLLCEAYNRLYPTEALSEDVILCIENGAKMHDIGKITIPDAVLKKKGKLTETEYREVQRHTVIGASIVSQMAELYKMDSERQILMDICLYHHERYDGSGYPDGLSGDQIPLSAQFVSIADTYEAMTESSYRQPMPHEDVVSYILSGCCGTFNPKLLRCFEAASAQFKEVLSLTDSNEQLINNAYVKDHRRYWICKRTLDVALSSLALIVLAPFMLLIAALIFLDDPHGSPIFCQKRIGRHRKQFTMYKFRTMVVNAEALKTTLMQQNEKDGPVFKIARDPRVTRVGRFLRKTSLDELPQLINIIRGDMSIVGPRPPLASEVQAYTRFDELRLSITPGLTCDWQVQPSRDSISFEHWIDMDVSYIALRSIRHDFGIIMRTVRSVFHHDGT